MTALQDDIDDAEEITSLRGSIAADITGFTADTGAWADPTDLQNYQSGWVKLTIDELSQVLLDTTGSLNNSGNNPPNNVLDTEVAIYSGTPGDLTLVGSNDQGDTTGDASELSLLLDAGTYYIETDAYNNDGMILVLNWLITPLSAHGSGVAVAVKDIDGIARPVEIIMTTDGQVRQVVAIAADSIVPAYDSSNRLATTVPLLSSGTRNSTTVTPGTHRQADTNTNVERYGGDFVLKVTANPGGGQTLSVKLQVEDNVPPGDSIDWVDWGVVVTAANGTFHLLCYPGAIAADAAAGVKVKGMPLPNQFHLVVTHSGGGNWTYEIRWVPLD
jgi:hypothetical protein